MFKVTNNSERYRETPFVAKYAGRDYKFPFGRTVAVDDDAAVHIFAIGKYSTEEDADKARGLVFLRHGWITPIQGLKPGLDILEKFTFERINPSFDLAMADGPIEDEHAPYVPQDGEGRDSAESRPSAGRGKRMEQPAL